MSLKNQNRNCKKIVFITHVCPVPAQSGDTITILGSLLFFLEYDCQVTLLICCSKSISDDQRLLVSNLLPSVQVEYIASVSRWEGVLDEVRIQAQCIVDDIGPDLIWVEYANLSRLVHSLNCGRIPIWFRSHNFELMHYIEKELEHEEWREWGRGSAWLYWGWKWLKKIFNGMRVIYSHEWRMHRVADKIFYISVSDMNVMKFVYMKFKNSHWLPPRISFPDQQKVNSHSPLNVVYLGSNYVNNVNMSGAKKLLEKIIPLVEIEMPGTFKFHFVGKAGKSLLGQFQRENVVIHDFVDDLDSFMNEMDIVCSPVSIGWGCKIKVAEALARGIPVIASIESLRGFPESNLHFGCGSEMDYLKAFEMLKDEKKRKKISIAAQDEFRLWLNKSYKTLSVELSKLKIHKR